MADGRITGTRRALKRSQARKYANTIKHLAETCYLKIERDSFRDAEISADHLSAHLEVLRELITELKR